MPGSSDIPKWFPCGQAPASKVLCAWHSKEVDGCMHAGLIAAILEELPTASGSDHCCVVHQWESSLWVLCAEEGVCLEPLICWQLDRAHGAPACADP